jgi:hypothetical protein
MNYEEKLKNYIQVNKGKNEFKFPDRNIQDLRRKDILQGDMNSSENCITEKNRKNNFENRFDYYSMNFNTKCSEKTSESDRFYDRSLKMEMRNYKRLIEDCLDYDLPQVKNVSDI